MGKNKKDMPRVLKELNMVFTENVSYEVFDKFVGEICKDLDAEYHNSIYCVGKAIRQKCNSERINGRKTFDYKVPTLLLFERLHYILMYYYWSKSKEIFDFDKDFTKELTRTPIAEIPIDKLRELPYNTFCCQHGNSYIIVHRSHDLNINEKPNVLEGEFIYLFIRKEGQEKIDFIHLPLRDEFKSVETLRKHYAEKVKNTKEEVDKAIDDALEYINVLMYLVSDKGDIAENPKQKTITRRTGVIKNNFREVRKWDVGYRFGSVFRKQKANEENKTETNISRTGISTGLGVKKRAHIRRGHWHSFWTGKRDGEERKQIIKWISPIAINFEKDSPAVIHKVK